MAASAEIVRTRGRVGGLARSVRRGDRAPDDPAVAEAHRDLAAAKIAAYVKRVLGESPPLTNEQRSRLAELLSPVRGGAA